RNDQMPGIPPDLVNGQVISWGNQRGQRHGVSSVVTCGLRSFSSKDNQGSACGIPSWTARAREMPAAGNVTAARYNKDGGDGGRRSAKSPRAARCRHITGGFMPALPPERPGCPKVPGGRRPLPDPAAVRLCLVPDSAPPYDDEIVAGEPPGRARGGADDGRWGGAVDGCPAAARGSADDGRPAAATVTPAAGRPATVRSASTRSAAKAAAGAAPP